MSRVRTHRQKSPITTATLCFQTSSYERLPGENMAVSRRVLARRCLLQVGCLDTAPASSLGCLVSALSCDVLCCGDLEVRHRRQRAKSASLNFWNCCPSLRVIGHSPPLLTTGQVAQQVGNYRQVLVDVVSFHWRKLDEIGRRFINPDTAREHICRYLCTYYDFLNLGQVTFVFPGNLTGNHFDSFLQEGSREYTKILHKVLGF